MAGSLRDLLRRYHLPPRIICPKDQAAGAFIVQFLPPWLEAAPGADIQSIRESPEDGLSLPAPFPTQLQLRQAGGPWVSAMDPHHRMGRKRLQFPLSA